jgi:hypothetical protein
MAWVLDIFLRLPDGLRSPSGSVDLERRRKPSEVRRAASEAWPFSAGRASEGARLDVGVAILGKVRPFDVSGWFACNEWASNV